MSTTFIEGSVAVAKTVGVCRPHVISAYPITPQTHIIEHLSELVANGEIKAEYVNVESEHSAASVVLGASATGARTYTATTISGIFAYDRGAFQYRRDAASRGHDLRQPRGIRSH